MSILSVTNQQSVFKQYHSDKHFSEFLLTRWRQKSTGIDIEQNYVTVILCIAALSCGKFPTLSERDGSASLGTSHVRTLNRTTIGSSLRRSNRPVIVQSHNLFLALFINQTCCCLIVSKLNRPLRYANASFWTDIASAINNVLCQVCVVNAKKELVSMDA